MKKLSFFGASFFKIKIADIFKWIKYLGKSLSLLRNGVIGASYCWNYELSKLLLHFIEYRLDQLNNIFWKPLSKEIFDKSSKFFGPPTTKWRPCKFFVNLNGNHFLMAKSFKLHKYQTFGLSKIHNMSKIWFANKKFSFSKSLVYDCRKYYLTSLPFSFFQISNDYYQNSYGKTIFFYNGFRGYH